jgi:hypothetical protein
MAAAEALEQRMAELRAAAVSAVRNGDHDAGRRHRADLARAAKEWDRVLGLDGQDAAQAVTAPAASASSLLTVREQVHAALGLLGVPAKPALLSKVHLAFFGAPIASSLTSLRRDEKRSHETAPGARPYYICPALGKDLYPLRGLFAISGWPLAQRIILPSSPRADFLAAAVSVAEACERLPDHSPDALDLLSQFALHVRGSRQDSGDVSPQAVILAAQAELEHISGDDRRARDEAAGEARKQLDERQQLFGGSPPFRPERPRQPALPSVALRRVNGNPSAAGKTPPHR